MKVLLYLFLIIVIIIVGNGKSSIKEKDIEVIETEVVTEIETTEVETTIEIETETESESEIEETTTMIETTEESKEQEVETDGYGWTSSDYEEFAIAVKLIADNYLTGYKLPHYTNWQFNRFDNKGKIFAMTDELTFRGDNEKHTLICVFLLSGDVGENGLHEEVKWSFFGTDERTYYDDGTCKEVFDLLK